MIIIRDPTEREKQCLAASLVYGRKEAAYALGITVATLRNHLSSINYKLGVETAREAAIVLGWLNIPEQYLDCSPDILDHEIHHPISEQLLNYADALLDQLELARN